MNSGIRAKARPASLQLIGNTTSARSSEGRITEASPRQAAAEAGIRLPTEDDLPVYQQQSQGPFAG